MSNTSKRTFGEKVDKAIRYDKSSDTYTVRFNFKEDATIVNFPTLEEAIKYRDEIYKEKYEYKLTRDKAIIRKKTDKILQDLRDCYPENVFNILNEMVVGRFNYEKNIILDIDRLSPYLEGVIESKLTPAQKFVFNGYFKDIKPLNELGGEIDVTKSRVQQVLKKALFKIKLGLLECEAELKFYEQKEERKKELEELKAQRERLILALGSNEHLTDEQLKNIELFFGLREEERIPKHILEQGIDVLNLSVRSYNALRRAKINVIGDLTKIDKHKLVNVRNLGRKSLKEILDKMHAYGIGLADETEEEIEGYFSAKNYIKDFQFLKD